MCVSMYACMYVMYVRTHVECYYIFVIVMPGKVFHQEIANMIRKECRKTVIILSPDFINSKWCSYEADLAMVDSPGIYDKIS